jgi:hypothetical protein
LHRMPFNTFKSSLHIHPSYALQLHPFRLPCSTRTATAQLMPINSSTPVKTVSDTNRSVSSTPCFGLPSIAPPTGGPTREPTPRARFTIAMTPRRHQIQTLLSLQVTRTGPIHLPDFRRER